jgi:predicted MPP superfamily phosphohydrolase
MDESDVDRAVRIILNEQPDLMLLGGDYISASPRFAVPASEIFRQLVDGIPLGVIAVLGNHDCGEKGRAEIVTAALANVGITVLRNESREVPTGSGSLWIAGIDEAIMATSDPDAAFARIPGGAASLALWHEPDYARFSAALGAFAQLSGHSHGGQVRIPGIGPLFLPRGGRRYVMGQNFVGSMPVYTSRGAGVFMPPVRFNCPPEVTLVTLE